MGASERLAATDAEMHGAWQMGVEAYLDRIDDVEEDRQRGARRDRTVSARNRLLAAAHRGRGKEVRPAGAQRQRRCAPTHDREQSAPRREDLPPLPESRSAAARSDRRGQSRIDPRSGEVRRRPRFPLLHVCDLVDPSGDRTRADEPDANDSPAGPRRKGNEPVPARGARTGAKARPRAECG